MPKRLSRKQQVLLAEVYYWRAALQRRDDSEILIKAERTTGAVYLAGYATECAMKAWVLTVTPKTHKEAMLDSFRGRFGHDLELLRMAATRPRGEILSRPIAQDFAIVNSWNTDLRYFSGPIPLREAQAFVDAVDRLLGFVKGRL